MGLWVVSSVERCLNEDNILLTPNILQLAESAGEAAVSEVGPRVHSLLESDIDTHGTTPLEIVRGAVKYPTRVLNEAGVNGRKRDAFAISRFPDDMFGLTPASLAVLGDDVWELSIIWGAAKAFEHKRRHR